MNNVISESCEDNNYDSCPIMVRPPGESPTVDTAASATPNPVAGQTTELSVLGGDVDTGESSLTYTWVATSRPSGAANPTFSVNRSNAAKNTTATFSKAGNYAVAVSIADPDGYSVISRVVVTVDQTLTTITVNPSPVTLGVNAVQQFNATAGDQFGDALTSQPTFAWTTTVGTISATGWFTAPDVSTTGTVTATSGTTSGTAQVTVRVPGPAEITVLSGTTEIVCGQTTPIVVGSAIHGTPGPSTVITIRNDGDQTLLLTAPLTSTAHFTVGQPGTTSVAPGQTTSFVVTLETAAIWSGAEPLSLVSNDGDNGDGVENPFTFFVSGVVLPTPPEIVVMDGTTEIISGQIAPIDFGDARHRGSRPSKTFTIRNLGDQTLVLNTPTVAGTHFLVSQPDRTSLAANEVTTFTVTLLTNEVWTGSEQISFVNNDADNGDGIESPFTFLVSGTVSPIRMTASDVSLPEGNVGVTSFQFALTLLNPTTDSLSVNYSVVGDTATAGKDFLIGTGSVEFGPGQTEATVYVGVIGDKICEGDETFRLLLTDPATHEVLAEGHGTIRDDDAPRVSINNVKIHEGKAGATKATFTVKLSAKSSRDATVFYSTSDGSASADDDYQSIAGSVVIRAGKTKQTFTVLVNGDKTHEANETFKVNLTNAVDAEIVPGKDVGTATIVNDDTVPTVSIDNATLDVAGSVTRAVFLVKLSAPSGLPAKVKFSTANGTAHAGTDYAAVSGTLEFAPGETQKSITVDLFDPAGKVGKKFSMKLSGPTEAKIGKHGKGVCTIQAVSPGVESLLETLASARKQASRANSSQDGPIVDEALRRLMLTGL